MNPSTTQNAPLLEKSRQACDAAALQREQSITQSVKIFSQCLREVQEIDEVCEILQKAKSINLQTVESAARHLESLGCATDGTPFPVDMEAKLATGPNRERPSY